MTKHIIDELTIGSFDCPEIKCGFIGEVGCSFPLHGTPNSRLAWFIFENISTDFERKSIQASAHGQEATGAPVSFHPGRDPESPYEIMRIFTEAGGNGKKAIMGHLESIFCFNNFFESSLQS